jgi:hypothetical protein
LPDERETEGRQTRIIGRYRRAGSTSGQVDPGTFPAVCSEERRAKPEENVFTANRNVGIDGFIPVREIWGERRFLVDRLPPHAFPVARDGCGNYVVIDQGEGGTVYFWDHELHDPLTRLADDWDLLLAGLEPFDPGSIKLRPGGATVTVFDPELFQQLKERDRKT